MKVIKRDCTEVEFDKSKIYNAILKAMKNGSGIIKENIARDIADEIYNDFIDRTEVSISDIENKVYDKLISKRQKLTAKAYEGYRSIREFQRENENTTDTEIEELLTGTSDYWSTENSNKDEKLVTTQRDYMAGIVSKDITRRYLLPPEIVQANDDGIIHFHDIDYFGQNALHNCDLINLEDMLQNGTVISGTLIEKPHSFSTACNIATQIIAQVASSQYGGQTITLSHLAPFVNISREKIRKEITSELLNSDLKELPKETLEEYISETTNKRLAKEIEKGIQTIQYQVITLMTTNGQAPFLSVCMYLDEVPEGQTRDDLALLIEEMLKQRIIGVKNEQGVWITPAFPKLLYVLDEDNVYENSKYYYLTELAAKCTAKRMVPDYISAKKMREYKNGDVYPCMGCVDGKEVVAYKYNNNVYVESFERMWDRLSKYFEVGKQLNQTDYFMETPGVKIYDQKNGFVDNYGVIKNRNSEWLRITFSNGRTIMCTPDHPFETIDGRVVYANDLTENDSIEIDKTSSFEISDVYVMKENRAWLYGFALCDSTYYDGFTASIAASGEDEIETNFSNIINDEYGLSVKTICRDRGKKGVYKDLRVISNCDDEYIKFCIEFIKAFDGKAKINRHIPNEVFSWSKNARLAFIAGMIDADGCLNTSSKKATIQIGSINKELAIQQALLAQTCGMFAKIYHNHYRSDCKDKIRYRVEFTPTEELLKFIKCEKKTNLSNSILCNTNYSISFNNTCSVKTVERIKKDGFSYDVTTASEHFTVSGIYSHNCRSFLTTDRFTDTVGNISNAKNFDKNKKKYYGRFNQGVVTINLVDVALSSNKNMTDFWRIFDERLELCHKALRIRHERLKGTSSNVAPILWRYGAIARLDKGETIDKLLYDGYSTISLGYAGLYECVKYMTGCSNSDGEGKKLGLEVMQYINDKCNEWKTAENIDYSPYGSPIESTTYKFAKCLKKRFGVIEGITDRNYITNSYHIPVFEKINPFDKLAIESEFQSLSPGGAISYIETSDMGKNIPAVLEVIKYIYDNIMYAELNTKSDYCQVCGYDGEIKIIDENNELIWECPNCHNRDKTKMNVARRTCGYIGVNFWNQGRTQEINERFVHLSDIEEDLPR